MELTPDYVVNLSGNVGKVISRKGQLQKFLKLFPFEQLLSLKFMGSDISGHSIELLQQLASQRESYQNLQFINCTVEFVLVIVAKLHIDKDTLTNSLCLMETVLSQLTSLTTLEEEIIQPERISEVLVIASRSRGYDKKCANLSARILIKALNITQVNIISTALRNALVIMFEACHKQDAVSGMCDIASYVLQRCDTLEDYFSAIYSWISEESCKYLKVMRNFEVSCKLIDCLNHFLRKCDVVRHTTGVKYYNQLNYHLKARFGTICKMCFYPALRRGSVEILGQVVADFLLNTNIPVSHIRQLILYESEKLREHITQWPFMNSNLFLFICHILYLNDTLLWSDDDIRNAMKKQLERLPVPRLSVAIMRSILFLSSVLIADFPEKLTLYDSILSKFPLLSAFPEVYTFHAAQLTWVLNRGTTALKITVLKEWLKHVQDDEKITSVVKQCKAGYLLLDILKEQHEESALQRTASLIRKQNDEDLGLQVASLMPLGICRPSFLRFIVIANPVVPKDSNKALILCSLMGTIILRVSGEDVLKGICSYSKKLLHNLRGTSCALEEFCKNSSNMSAVVDLTKRVSEPTALTIMRLLQTLLLIQEINHLTPTINLAADLGHLLVGSEKKVSKALQLYRQILSLEKPFLNFEEKSLLSIFYKLLNLTDAKGLASQAYLCLVLLIQKEPKLALTPISYMHVELNCTRPVDARKVQMFLRYVINWLKALHILDADDLRIISLSMVKDFIIQSSLIVSLNAQKYIDVLDSMV